MERFVQKLKAYAPLAQTEIAAIKLALGAAQSFAAHTTLITYGSHSGSLLVMLDGWAMHCSTLAAGTRQIMGFVLPGEAFDTRTNFSRKTNDYVETITPVQVAVVPSETLDGLLNEWPGVARAIAIANIVEQATLRSSWN